MTEKELISKLNKFSKKELVDLILKFSKRIPGGLRSHYYLEHLLSDLDMIQANELADQAREMSKKSLEYLGEYNEFCKKYGGKKISEIPLDDVKKASNDLEQFKVLSAESRKLFDKSDKMFGY